MADENACWGAPKIHGELRKLGFEVSERTVARYLRRIRRRGHSGKKWLALLNNHREVIVAFDFFTVPTVTFQLLYCFFVIAHGRRKILHFNRTRRPTADWVVQQLREAFPEASPYRYVILDRDSKFDADVIAFLKATGLKPKRTSVQAPWQNGISERWVGSCRREILDHVIPLHEAHLRRLIRDYVDYHHDDRIHDALEKDTPNRRPVEPKPSATSMVISMPRLGGLHHRYSWQQVASSHATAVLLSSIAKIEITNNGHRRANRPNDATQGRCGRNLPKPFPWVAMETSAGRPPAPHQRNHAPQAPRYVSSLRPANAVLTTHRCLLEE